MSVSTAKGFSNVGKSLLNDNLEQNLSIFFDHITLNAGAFFNVDINTSGAYGGNASRLRLDKDPNYTAGQVWSGYRFPWVWESGLNHGVQPIKISGVYVNDTFYSLNTTGDYSYKIDYRHGRVIFNSAISTSATVKVEHSFKWFNFSTADAPWYRELQFNSFRVDDVQFLQDGSGAWQVPPHKRLQLPAIVVETAGRRSFRGNELGGGKKVYQDVFFHIFSEDHWGRKQLVDITTYQDEKKFYLFDVNTWSAPLNDDGSLTTTPRGYINWIAESGNPGGAFWKNARFAEMAVVDHFNRPPLFGATVRATVEVIMSDL